MSLRKTLFACLAAFPLAVAADPAPDFSLPGRDGPVTLSALHGRVVYVDFWASWCTPCRQSFPWMSDLQRRYERQGLTVVAINLDNEPLLAKRFLETNPPGFTIAYDADGNVAERYDVQGMPSSFIVGRDGELKNRHVGFREKDRAELERLITELLAGSGS